MLPRYHNLVVLLVIAAILTVFGESSFSTPAQARILRPIDGTMTIANPMRMSETDESGRMVGYLSPHHIPLNSSYNFSPSSCPPTWNSYCNGELQISGQHLTLMLPTEFANPNGIYEINIRFYDNGVGFYVALYEMSGSSVVNSVAFGLHPGPAAPAVAREYYYAFIVNGALQTLRSGIPRVSNQFHKIALRVTPHGTYAAIDGFSISYLPSAGSGVNPGGVHRLQTKAHQLQIGQAWTGGTARFDDLSIIEHPLSVTYKQLSTAPNPAAIEKYYGSLLVTNPQMEPFFWSKATSDWDRVRAQGALVYAFAHLTQPGAPPCTNVSTLPDDPDIPPPSPASYCDKARYLIRSMMGGTPYPPTGRFAWRQGWLSGAPAYSSRAIAYSLGMAIGLIHKDIAASETNLPLVDRTMRWALAVLDQEADFWKNRLQDIKNCPNCPDPVYVNHPSLPNWTYAQAFSRYLLDTSAEEQGTAAMFLGIWGHLRRDNLCTDYSEQGLTNGWVHPANVYGFHTLTTGESYGGLYSQTMNLRNGKYILENHDFAPMLNYSFALVVPASVYPVRKQFDPIYFDTHQFTLWDETKNYYSLNTFLHISVPNLCHYPAGTPYPPNPNACQPMPNNIFSITGRGDWGDDVTWNNNAFAYAAKKNPATEMSRYIQLLRIELALRPDYLAFPLSNWLTLHKPAAVTTNTYYDGKKTGDMAGSTFQVAERHIVAYLIQDTTLFPQSVASGQNSCISLPPSGGNTVLLPYILKN